MSEVAITISGKNYKLSKFNAQMHQEYLDWSKTALPDPVLAVVPYWDKIPADMRREMLDIAMVRNTFRGSLADHEAKALVNTKEGATKFLSFVFRYHHPELTDEQIMEIAEAGKKEHGDKIWEEVFGKAQGTFQADGN